jgi:5'-methylthioadenosine phosphorylase
VDIIGMTNVPEVRLAREAEMCYATVALSTDYDCWHEAHADVSVDAVLEIVRQNVHAAKRIISAVVAMLAEQKATCSCSEALKYAIMTDPSVIPEETARKMDLLFGKYLQGN